MLNIDYSLYLVTDRQLSAGRDLIKVVKKAVQGGVTMVQIREKDSSTREFYQLALRLKEELDNSGIPLLINDRLDIALAVNADGLHIGQDDLPLPVARRILGKSKIIGLSASNREQARQGQRMEADYLGIGPVFWTPSKTDADPPTGIELLSSLKQEIKIPLVAIGGINRTNLAEIKKAGADGVAVISALLSADDVEAEARRMMGAWKNN